MENSEIVYLYLDDIIPNRFQPREVFDEQALRELAISIKEHGVIQPIIVRKVENKYEIIAGERRYKASTMAGLTKIPAIVRNLDDKESSKVALIENLQRRDLTPIEEARTYQKILQLEKDMTQEELAQTMGKTQSSVSNKLRLLALPEELQEALLKEKISERHARTLLNLVNKNDQIKMLDRIVNEKMTVRDLDREIKIMNEKEETENGGQSVPSNITFPEPNNMVNPTRIDIDRMRENAKDIKVEKPQVNMDTLMRTGNEQEIPTSKFFMPIEEDTSKVMTAEEEAKIIDSAIFSTNPIENHVNTTSDDEVNSFNRFLESIANNDNKGLNSFSPPVSLQNNKKDVVPVVADIKSKVRDVEALGYKVSLEENDSDDSYLITIKIDKNS